MLKIYDLTVDLVKNPLAASLCGTRFSWKLDSERSGTYQKSYRLVIASEGNPFFDSGVIEGNESVEISFPALSLSPATVYSLTVEITDNYGEQASETASFATELPAELWAAKWIKPTKHYESWAPYVRKKFKAEKSVKRAMLYASGLGCAEYYINGQRISDDYIDPPMTNYTAEVLYRVFDVTGFLLDKNCFAALLGDGWYSQSRVWTHGGFKYGDVCLCAELHIEYEDGTSEIIATDDTWTYKYSPIVLNNLYGGETYDTRFETPDFADYEGDEEDWKPCKYDDVAKGELRRCNMPPVKIIRTIPAVSVTNCSGKDDGAWIIDMGENFAGIAEFHLPRCAKGSQYVFRFAETLNDGGHLDHRSVGSFATQCIQQDVYIARGDKEGEVYRPRFTYHGFRYIEITGYFDLRKYGMNPDVSIATGYALSTDLSEIGSFSCDHDDLNRFHKIMKNTFLSNYHGLPEDCPAREKCGWLGDAQVVCNTGMMNYDMGSSYEKYMQDIRTTRDVCGVWQMIAPGKRGCGEASPLWGCAQIIIPYYMYRYLGDERVVRDHFDLMEAWVEHEKARSEDLLIDVGLGDWAPSGGNKHERRMPVKHSSSMMFYEICLRMNELCKVLGYSEEKAAYYASLGEQIKESIIRNLYDKEKHSYGYWGSDGVALQLGIYPDGDKDALLEALVNMIKDEDFELHTGIYANKYLIPALCEGGYGDMALQVLFTPNHPSFRTMMDDGATSVWECYDMKSIMLREWPVSSYNHPMHGGFAYFYYAHIAGITPITPAFSRFAIKPIYFDAIGEVDVTYKSVSGRIGVKYRRKNGKYAYEITVPANTTCEFTPIGGETVILTSGTYKF
ncbi:MAG: family 78 glycoside hydrolase catalytic domain [Clostridia bacterium]|nr:family 78 glycoside hydrolase catalytic domain [Clostridia bacterium]